MKDLTSGVNKKGIHTWTKLQLKNAGYFYAWPFSEHQVLKD